MDDPFRLRRFVDAQEGLFEDACAELRRGRKTTHWMWFVFPQIAGLGRSATSQFFAISGIAEARGYLAHPVLGERLRHCVRLVNGLQGLSAADIFGGIDGHKFHSCLTLFATAAPDEAAFAEALGKYFGGRPDAGTLARL